ncbi:MAG: DJ-1 family protein [Chitinivibrionales bacterium]|nr:DJ-1 family protein [Chitinivibrionales bacterium]MBD3357402.1 DJ-1 family protein [Chitinivibrionales bacterium]
MINRVLTLFAPGLEEIEAVTSVDLLRRAEVEVTIAGVGTTQINGSHGITFEADTTLAEFHGEYDGIVLPGGMPGTTNLSESEDVLTLIKRAYEAGKLCAAICAAPLVFDVAGILGTHRYTCYPGVDEKISGGTFAPEPVVRDKNVITSKGVGTAISFALELIDFLKGPETAQQLKQAIVFER